MPTIHREEGFEFMIYVNDHGPAHIHVYKAGGKLILNLGEGETPVSIREISWMSRSDVRRALRITQRMNSLFLERWGEIHG